MKQVRRFIAGGMSVPEAIKAALKVAGYPEVKIFAHAKRVPRQQCSMMINLAMRPTEPFITAIVETLGGTPIEWRRLLWKAAEPVEAAEPVDEVKVAS